MTFGGAKPTRAGRPFGAGATLRVDFSARPGTHSNIFRPANALDLNGGGIFVTTRALGTGPQAQTFSGTTLEPGYEFIDIRQRMRQ